MLEIFGAEIVLTPGNEGMQESSVKQKRLSEESTIFYASAINNPANPEIHQRTTVIGNLGRHRGP